LTKRHSLVTPPPKHNSSLPSRVILFQPACKSHKMETREMMRCQEILSISHSDDPSPRTVSRPQNCTLICRSCPSCPSILWSLKSLAPGFSNPSTRNLCDFRSDKKTQAWKKKNCLTAVELLGCPGPKDWALGGMLHTATCHCSITASSPAAGCESIFLSLVLARSSRARL